MTESGVHLTTSRVNRLLRPLRNKCTSLATLPKATATSRVTYSTQSSNWHPDAHPPLAVLCFSAATRKLTLDRRSADEFELSRRIHAVCDAFKNVAHAALGRPCSERIPSLATMCALVVSENMPAIDTLATSGEGTTDDVLDADGIYETVPPHYRRYLIISHALSMILCICTHHHTLVTILLDHCLSFGLVHESTRLLNIVLAQAFLPSNLSYSPPATHPGHVNYLLDLHIKWINGNRSPGTPSDTPLFTTSAFCRVLFGTLSQSSSCHSHSLWTSKVLNRLLHSVGGCDIDSYICIVRTLAQSFWETSGSSPDAIRDDTQLVTLRDKLSEMMSNLFDLLFTQHDSHPPPSIPSRIYTAIDMLHDCYAARLHRLRMSTPSSPIDLPDVIIIFTVHIFVAFRSSVGNFDQLSAILNDSSPIPTTFSKLMVYFSRSQGDQAFEDFAEAFLSELRLYSLALRSERLFRLDASLWACALRHFETSTATSQKASSALVARYKRQLMEAVDTAERRCFGSSPVVSIARTTTAGASRTHHARTSGHWEWEDMVGSWIRRTPVRKKRKIDDNCLHTPLRNSNSRPWGAMTSKVVSSTAASMPISTSHRRSSTCTPSSSCSQFSDPEFPTDDGSEYQGETDKENYPTNPRQTVKGPHRIKHRSSNFFSLLADARTNRIVLHSKGRSELNPPLSVIPERCVLSSSQESRHAPRRREQNICRKTPPPPAPPKTMPLSDDSLNLFACATSSPVRC